MILFSWKGKPIADLAPQMSPEATLLLETLLVYEPDKRLKARTPAGPRGRRSLAVTRG